MSLLETFDRVSKQPKDDVNVRDVLGRLSPSDACCQSLDYWKSLVRHAKTSAEVLAVVDRFRPLAWTDEQRAQMSHAYQRRLACVETQT